MKAVLCALAVLCVAGVVHATGSAAVLAPNLESFLESGSHTEAEINAMAEAEIAAVLNSASASDSEADLEAAAEAAVEAEAGMPRDTKQQKRDERRRRAQKALAAAAAAKNKPNPPPKPFNPVAAAATSLIPDGSDRDDLIKLVYDELKRLGSSNAAVAGTPGTPGTPSIVDPRIQTLESRLTMFEKRRTEEANKAQDSAIASITARLEGLDKTLATLKKSAEQQQALSAQLLRASKAAQMKEAAGSPVIDYSVSYEKATLPADFEKKVGDILKSVKTEARKIYERYCKRFKRAAAKKAAAKKAAAAKPGSPEAAVAAVQAAQAEADAHAAKRAMHGGGGAEGAPASGAAAAAAVGGEGESALGGAAPAKEKKLLFSPVIAGKEPTPEGMRLSKALNDVATALPVTPAYQLGREQQALHDVLGESAVNPKFKTPRL